MSIAPIGRNRRKGPKSPGHRSFVSSVTAGPAAVGTDGTGNLCRRPTDSRRAKFKRLAAMINLSVSSNRSGR
jgi:hypothetical protein